MRGEPESDKHVEALPMALAHRARSAFNRRMRTCCPTRLAAFLLIGCGSQDPPQPPETENPVARFVRAFDQDAARNVAKLVRYPISPASRGRPLHAPIRNPMDFERVFPELFPTSLIQRILTSDPRRDWPRVGLRGHMFSNGLLWLDEEGRLIAHNGRSSRAEERQRRALASDRAALHPSLRNHKEPLLAWTTSQYRIRVDRLPDGRLRYASWKREAPPNSRPDLVLANGTHRIEGTARNETYTFANGPYQYRCAIHRVGTAQTPPLELRVTREKTTLLREPAVAIYISSHAESMK